MPTYTKFLIDFGNVNENAAQDLYAYSNAISYDVTVAAQAKSLSETISKDSLEIRIFKPIAKIMKIKSPMLSKITQYAKKFFSFKSKETTNLSSSISFFAKRYNSKDGKSNLSL